MGSINPFKSPPSAPAPVIIQPAPIEEIKPVTLENSEEETAADAAALKEKLKKQRGRAATMIAGDDVSAGSGTATKTLLGG